MTLISIRMPLRNRPLATAYCIHRGRCQYLYDECMSMCTSSPASTDHFPDRPPLRSACRRKQKCLHHRHLMFSASDPKFLLRTL